MDTTTGILSYVLPPTKPTSTNEFSTGAIVTYFLHLGQGNVVSVPIFFNGAIAPGLANAGPGKFLIPLTLPLTLPFTFAPSRYLKAPPISRPPYLPPSPE